MTHTPTSAIAIRNTATDPQARSLLHLLLVQASTDPALDNNSIPRVSTPKEADRWLRNSGWRVWLIQCGTTPAGCIGLHEPQLTDNPEPFRGYLESDSYLLPAFRGQRIASQAWTLLREQFPPGTRFVAEIWEDNSPSIRRVERDGWVYVGRFHWQNPTNPSEGGFCRRYVFTTPPFAPE